MEGFALILYINTRNCYYRHHVIQAIVENKDLLPDFTTWEFLLVYY